MLLNNNYFIIIINIIIIFSLEFRFHCLANLFSQRQAKDVDKQVIVSKSRRAQLSESELLLLLFIIIILIYFFAPLVVKIPRVKNKVKNGFWS